MDSALSPNNESDSRDSQAELPVDIDSITIDGTQPEVGDSVDLKVTGSITRLVNGTAYVRPETVNDQPMPEQPLVPNDGLSEMDRLEQLSNQHASGGASPDANY